MVSRSLAVLVLVTSVGIPAAADVLPPDAKWIRHSARFENLADFPDYVFFVAHHPNRQFLHHPEARKKEAMAIEAQRLDPQNAVVGLGGNPISGDKYLLAVPRSIADRPGVGPNSDWFDGKTPGVLQVSINRGYRTAPITDPRDEFWTHFQVAIDSGEMTLTPTRDDRPGDAGGSGSPNGLPGSNSARWYIAGGLAAAAVVLFLGWILYLRRKRG